MSQILDNKCQKNLLPTTNSATGQIKVYKRRWIILTLYILYAAINAFQWFEYSIISNVIMKYYNVTALSVDWTSIIYMALYMPMVVPASYWIDEKGLRVTALIGVLGTALGTTIKVFSLNPGRMWLIYLAQTILSSMQVFILALPPRIAAVWFAPNEVSLACSMGVFGTQLGQAAGLFLPPIMVKDSISLKEVANDLSVLVYGLAIIAVVIAICVIIYFPAKPPLPPNKAVVNDQAIPKFSASLKSLMMDEGFVFLSLAYGIIIAVFVSISTLLNQFVLFYFVNSQEDAGRIGLIMVVLGMIGSVGFGYILDKTHKYKQITLGIYTSSLVALLLFMFALESRSKLLVYITGAMIGLFMNTYMVVGLELAVELTYPEPESTSSGIMISMTQTFGVFFTLLLGWLFNVVGCFWALASMALFLLIGMVLNGLVPDARKRQEAFQGNGNVVFKDEEL